MKEKGASSTNAVPPIVGTIPHKNINFKFKSRGVRQVKLVISCKVKVLVWINQRIDFIRFNQPPVSSVARLAERCLWLYGYCKREQQL